MGVLFVYPTVAGGGGADTLLGTFAVQETSGSSSLPVGSYVNGYYGFAAGAIPSGSKPELRKSDGTTALAVQQFDSVVTNSAGDTILGAFTFKTEDALAAGSEVNYTIYSTTGSLSNTSALTTADITGSHTYKVEAVVSGTTYTALLSDYIGGSDSYVTASGSVGKEWTVSGALKNGATPHAALWARFYVRLHEDGTTISIAAKLYNSYVSNGAAIVITSCALKDGATTIDSYASVTLPPNSCVRFGKSGSPWLRHWTANEPAFHIKYSMDEMQTGNLIFKMDNSAAFITAIGTAPSPVTYDPDDPAQFFGASDQDATGGSEWNGYFPDGDAKALITQDKDWHQYALSKQIYSHLAAAHWHESTGFYPPVMNNRHLNYSLGPDRKSVGANYDATLTITGRPAKYSVEGSHYPNWGYYPYISTGLREWFDEVQDHAISLIMIANPNTSDGTLANAYVRNPVMGGTTYYGLAPSPALTLRSMAWSMRMVDNAAFLTPSDDITRDYMRDILLVSHWPAMSAWVALNISDNARREPLGLVRYSYGDSSGVTLNAPWMSGYFAIVTAMAIRRGHIDTTHAWVTHHMIKYQIGRFLNGCPYNGATYNMAQEENHTVDGSNLLAIDWADVWVGDGALNQWELMIPGTGCPASGFNSTWANGGGHTYPAIAYAGLAALQAAGVTGADTAVAYFAANPGGTEAEWATAPQWRIRP